MTAFTTESPLPVGVVAALHLRTKSLHADAERSGIIRDLLRGQASRAGYVALLRNLLPAYREMECGLDRHRFSPGLDALARFSFNRAGAIEADLRALCGDAWSATLPLLPAADAYARRVAFAAEDDGARLIAHAYARYLGDLSGGLILRRLLAKSLTLHDSEMNFYDFSRFADPATLKTDFRRALDQAGATLRDPEVVIEEGAVAFLLNIDLSWAVHEAAPSTAMLVRTSSPPH